MALTPRLLTGGLLVVAIGAMPPAAQTTSASLTGTVRTAAGKPVVGAVAQARSEDTGVLRTALTDARGRYRIESLAPGRWTVVARLSDGRSSPRRTVRLELQETLQLDFTVSGGLAEQVVVTAETPLLDRRRTAGVLRVSNAQSEALPLAGRVFTDLALLDSAVRPAAPGNYFGERGSVMVINGQSGRSNSFLVDGLDNNDQTSGTTLNSFYSQQVIQEFVLLKHQFSPEFGRASGGVLNIVTRRGNNQRSWEVFAQGSPSRWNEAGGFVSRLPDSGPRQDAVRRYQAGFSFGGPVRRDRSFYFFAFEHQQSDDVTPFTGVGRDGVAGGRDIAANKDDSLFLRMDFNLTPSNTLMLRLSGDDRTTNHVNVGGVFTPEAGFRIEEQDLQLAAAWTNVLSENLVHEMRFLAATSSFDQFANSDRPGVARPSGIFGGNNLNRQLRDEDRFQIVDNLTWRRGRHTLKFGLDLLRSRTRVSARFNPNGNFIYNVDAPFEPGDCGNLNIFLVGLAGDDGVVPCPGVVGQDDDGDGVIDEAGNILTYPVVYSLIDGQPSALLEDTRVALFAQDRVEVGAKLLVDYGLRYDLSTYRLPRDARVESPIPNGGADRDTDNLAPRFGVTFTPVADGKTVLRGGVGVFYDKLVLGFPAVAGITSGTAIGVTFPQGLTFEVTEDVIEEQGVDSAQVVFPESLTLRFSTGTELETPYTVQANLGLERAIGRHGVLRADVIRALGYHLPLMLDLNPIVCVPDPDDTDGCQILPQHSDDTTGSIAAIVTEGRSWYTGVDVSWRWHHDDNWLSAAYTWAKAEDLGFDPLKGGISLPPQSDDVLLERGPADGNARHRVVFSGDFPLSFKGLRLSGVLQLATEIPFNVTTGQDDNLDGILSDRPDGVRRNEGQDSPLPPVNELRAAANDVNAALQLALLPPVTSLRAPSFAQLDLRLYKTFGLDASKGYGQVFLQVINVMNRENGGLIEGRAISQNLGNVITLAGPPRTVELGFKIGY